MRLRDRPWKLLALLLFGTTALCLFGFDLMDGEIRLRRIGHVNAATPIRFGLALIVGILSSAGLVFGWFVLRGEWVIDYRPRAKPALHDPERVRRH